MRLESLQINNLRCFDTLEYAFPKRVGLIFGANGSGKTTLLEAVAMLGLGRSFLSNRASELIRRGQDALHVGGIGREEGSDYRVSVSVSKTRLETRIEIDGLSVSTASQLAHRIPVLVINSKAPDLLSDSPGNRRALVDRTMFHVEPGYIDAWKTYRSALRQRNEIVRRQGGVRETQFWNEQLVMAAEPIDSWRRHLCEHVNNQLQSSSMLERIGQISLIYKPGWDEEQGLLKALEAGWIRDCRMGYTIAGIHRADLSIKLDGMSAAKRLSRGQSKAVVVAIMTALASFIEEQRGIRPAMLVDDLHAEMDDKMCASAVDAILERARQALFTAIRPTDLPTVADCSNHMFHVEQAAAFTPA